MIYKEFDKIEISDIQELIDNAIIENKTLEYKKELKIKKDSDKKEFLADISSFANSNGGQIIYGLKEENGIPTDISGTIIENIDIEIQKIEILQRGLDLT